MNALANRVRERDNEDLGAGAPEPCDQDISRPLDAGCRARIVARLAPVIADLGAAHSVPVDTTRRETSAPAGLSDPGEIDPGAHTASPAGRSSDRRRPGRRLPTWALPLAATVVAAFSALLYWTLSTDGAPPADAPLPAYQLAWSGRIQSARGGDAPAAPRVAVGNILRIIATPASPVEHTIAASAWRRAGGDTWRRIDGSWLAISPHGAVKLEATVGHDFDLPAGPVQLLLLLGDEAALPPPDFAATDATVTGTADGTGWRAFLLRFEIDAAP